MSIRPESRRRAGKTTVVVADRHIPPRGRLCTSVAAAPPGAMTICQRVPVPPAAMKSTGVGVRLCVSAQLPNFCCWSDRYRIRDSRHSALPAVTEDNAKAGTLLGPHGRSGEILTRDCPISAVAPNGVRRVRWSAASNHCKRARRGYQTSRNPENFEVSYPVH